MICAKRLQILDSEYGYFVGGDERKSGWLKSKFVGCQEIDKEKCVSKTSLSVNTFSQCNQGQK